MDVAFLHPLIKLCLLSEKLMDDVLYYWFIGFYLEQGQIDMASISMLKWVRK
jgi:hypothetical protein